MGKYGFYVQRMVQLAEIVRFEVIAENKEEADKIAAQNFSINPCEMGDEVVHNGTEVLWETEDCVEGTTELYDDTNNLIIKKEG